MKQIIVELIDNDEIVERLEFKSLKAMNKDQRFQNIDYYKLREVYLNTTNKRKAKHHEYNKNLIKSMRIYDSPNNKPIQWTTQPTGIQIKWDTKQIEMIPVSSNLFEAVL